MLVWSSLPPSHITIPIWPYPAHIKIPTLPFSPFLTTIHQPGPPWISLSYWPSFLTLALSINISIPVTLDLHIYSSPLLIPSILYISSPPIIFVISPPNVRRHVELSLHLILFLRSYKLLYSLSSVITYYFIMQHVIFNSEYFA